MQAFVDTSSYHWLPVFTYDIKSIIEKGDET